ncbi:MAG: hypothetical protein QXU28_01225 [Nitrososphaerota archaeon]
MTLKKVREVKQDIVLRILQYTQDGIILGVFGMCTVQSLYNKILMRRTDTGSER